LPWLRLPIGRGDDLICPHRPGNVSDLLFSLIDERATGTPTRVLVHRTGNENAAWIGQGADPGCHIHAIAVNVMLFHDHVAQMNADAKDKSPARRILRRDPRHAGLELHAASYGRYRAAELGQEAIARAFHDAAAMLLHGWFNHLCHDPDKAGMRTLLVGMHQPRVARDIGRDDGSKTARGHVRSALVAALSIAAAKAGPPASRGTTRPEQESGTPEAGRP
jgi:hypothetical protein